MCCSQNVCCISWCFHVVCCKHCNWLHLEKQETGELPEVRQMFTCWEWWHKCSLGWRHFLLASPVVGVHSAPSPRNCPKFPKGKQIAFFFRPRPRTATEVNCCQKCDHFNSTISCIHISSRYLNMTTSCHDQKINIGWNQNVLIKLCFWSADCLHQQSSWNEISGNGGNINPGCERKRSRSHS